MIMNDDDDGGGAGIQNQSRKSIFFHTFRTITSPLTPYSTLKTRANDGTSALLLVKHGFHDEIYSGGWYTGKSKFEKNRLFSHF